MRREAWCRRPFLGAARRPDVPEARRPIQPEEERLDAFGPVLARYSGTGQLIRVGKTGDCTFEAVQLRTGRVVVVCRGQVPFAGLSHLADEDDADSPLSLVGTAVDGRVLEAGGSPLVLESLWASPPVSTIIFQHLAVRTREAGDPAHIVYGITNFVCLGPVLKQVRPDQFVGTMPLRLRAGEREILATVFPTDDAKVVDRRLRRLKAADVAAEVVFDSAAGSREEIEEVLDDLCHVLSVARGTMVNWIYRVERDTAGKEMARHHFYRVTKDYSVSAIFAPNAPRETLGFTEAAYPIFVALRQRYQLKRGVIAAYLEAKTDADYLETRAIKAAAAMEMVKAAYLDGRPEHEFNLSAERYSEEVRKRLRDVMQAQLKLEGLNSRDRNDIAAKSKIRDLNRRSFESVLLKFFAEIGLTVEPGDVRLFAMCRNSLIHRGRFYFEAADAEDRAECPPKPSRFEEYEFMIEVLDRAFLRLLGYSGSYVNWRGRNVDVNAAAAPVEPDDSDAGE